MPETIQRPMGAAELSAIGEELLGSIWQRSLATLLGINLRTIQRCANGSTIMPRDIAARIVTLRDVVRQLRDDAAAARTRRAADLRIGARPAD